MHQIIEGACASNDPAGHLACGGTKATTSVIHRKDASGGVGKCWKATMLASAGKLSSTRWSGGCKASSWWSGRVLASGQHAGWVGNCCQTLILCRLASVLADDLEFLRFLSDDNLFAFGIL